MTFEMAQSFWRAYITMVNRNGARVSMFNPADDFTARAHMGEFDSLSDSEYGKRMDDVQTLSLFWDNQHSEEIGNILLNAIVRTRILDTEIDSIVKILADASVNTDYFMEEHAQECDESLFNSDLDFKDSDFKQDKIKTSLKNTPHNIYEFLNQHIYGQDAAKRAAAMLMYHHLRGNSRNMVMAGPTGSGKTEIWRTLSKKFDFIRIINGPQINCDGWKGSYHIKDIFWDEPRVVAEHLIIVIDEADKLFEPAVGASGTDYARKIQNELLKIMDGDTLTFVSENNKDKKVVVDCSGVSVVFCGSFERMLQQKTEASSSIGFSQQERTESIIAEYTEDDLIEYGNVRREIAGRIGKIVTLDMLDANDFEKIMESPVSPIQKMEQAHKVSLSVNEDSRRKLASDAVKSGLGCRYIRAKLQSMLDEQMFDAPNESEYELYYE